MTKPCAKCRYLRLDYDDKQCLAKAKCQAVSDKGRLICQKRDSNIWDDESCQHIYINGMICVSKYIRSHNKPKWCPTEKEDFDEHQDEEEFIKRLEGLIDDSGECIWSDEDYSDEEWNNDE